MAQTGLGSACHTEATGIGAGKGKGKGNVADEQLRLTGYLSVRRVLREELRAL